MIEMLPESSGNVLGFRVSGDVGRDDCDVLVPAVTEAVDTYGSVRLVLDMSAFSTEKAEAWGTDLKFGREFHHEVEKMAIVGHGLLGRLVAELARPFYARQAEYFEDLDAAWVWARS